MKKIKVFERNSKDEMGKERCFLYYLAVEEVDTSGFFCENYGVLVEEQGGMAAEVLGITTQKKRAEDLLEMLSFYKVSPTILEDVVADWL